MKNNRFLLRVTVINVICFFVGVYFYYLPTVHSQEAPFLSPPYFGSTTVNAIFDHEYPLYGNEDDNGFNGDVTTIVHRTNERLANLPGVIDANRYCVGYSGHDGIDYNLRYQYVLSSHAGTVVEATWDDAANHRLNLGLQVTLQTDEAQYRTIYGHMSTLLVEAGQQIDTETVIGISGSTGNSSGPHLHFTLQRSNNAQLPTYTDLNPYGWGSIETDPWTEDPPVRPASEDMWAHYPAIQNRNLGGNFPCTAVTMPYASGNPLELPDSPDPRLIPDLTAVTTYILDDGDDEFTAIGLWDTDNCATAACYKDGWHHTTTSGITAVWQPAAGIQPV